MSTIIELTAIAQAADDTWSALLRQHFGKQAGDVRYTPRGKGEEGSELRLAHNRFLEASKAMQDAWVAERAALRAQRAAVKA